jgi:hypothetical protein
MSFETGLSRNLVLRFCIYIKLKARLDIPKTFLLLAFQLCKDRGKNAARKSRIHHGILKGTEARNIDRQGIGTR